MRDLFHIRQCDVQKFQLFAVLFFQQVHRILQETGFHRTDIKETVDISHLKVQTGVFIQMSSGVVFFCTEYRTGFKDTVKYTDHHLFI
jgi:hypothetical protein